MTSPASVIWLPPASWTSLEKQCEDPTIVLHSNCWLRAVIIYAESIRTRAASGIKSFETLVEQNIKRSPLGRLVTLDEIAHLATFLCTDASSGMTGQTIYVDAGSHAMA